MRRKRRAPSRLVGRYFALIALLIIAISLLVQSLRPGDRATASDGLQVLYVLRGQAAVACGVDAQAAPIGARERAALTDGCTVTTGPGAEAALSVDHGRVLLVLGPNAVTSGAVERRSGARWRRQRSSGGSPVGSTAASRQRQRHATGGLPRCIAAAACQAVANDANSAHGRHVGEARLRWAPRATLAAG